MKYIYSFLLMIVVLTIAGTQIIKADECKVTDPTGTPLNVRASPNGRILQTIKNDTIVVIEQTTYDSKNRPWVQISQSVGNGRKILLWVFREFISCYSTKQATPKENWKIFFSKFKSAVENRDEMILEEMTSETIWCSEWKFCDPENDSDTRSIIFKALRKNNNRGWLQLKNFVNNGKELKDIYSDTDKIIALGNDPKCDDLGIWFEFKNEQWLFTGFSIAGGCGP